MLHGLSMPAGHQPTRRGGFETRRSPSPNTLLIWTCGPSSCWARLTTWPRQPGPAWVWRVAGSLGVLLSAGEVATAGLSCTATSGAAYRQEGEAGDHHEAVEYQWADSGRQGVVLPRQEYVA